MNAIATKTFQNKLNSFFPAYPVEKAWLFGSYARGEETDNSDVDILVRFDENAKISLFDYIGIKLDLEENLQKKVELVEDGYLLQYAKETADKDKILIYERKN